MSPRSKKNMQSSGSDPFASREADSYDNPIASREFILEKLEEEMAEDYSDEDEADILNIDQVIPTPRGHHHGLARPQDIMEASVDADAWRLELERVAPSLKVTVKMEGRDWRSNLEQIHQHRNNIASCMDSARSGLGQLQKEIKETLEKVGSRERHINIQLESQLTNYRQIAQVRSIRKHPEN